MSTEIAKPEVKPDAKPAIRPAATSQNELIGRTVTIFLEPVAEQETYYDNATILGFPWVGSDPWIRFCMNGREMWMPMRRAESFMFPKADPTGDAS